MAAPFDDNNLLYFPGVTPADVEAGIAGRSAGLGMGRLDRMDHPSRGASGANPAPSASWHRGVLAGLSSEERERAINEHFDAMGAFAGHTRSDDARQNLLAHLDGEALGHAPTSGLAETFALFPKAKLEQLARGMGLMGISKLNKGDLAQRIADEIAGAADETSYDLLNLNDLEFELLVGLVDKGPLSFAPDDLADSEVYSSANFIPLPPYIFLFKQGDTFTAAVPDELAAAIRAVDLDAVRAQRAKIAGAVAYAETATTYYGIIDLDAAYRQYCSLADDPLQPGDFAEAVYRSGLSGDYGFDLTERDDDKGIYLVDFMLSDAFAGPDALDDLDVYRDYLLAQQAKRELRPLDGLVCDDAFDRFYDMPAAVALRDYLDEHVPDDDDDYAYADRTMEDILELFYTGARASELPGDLEDMGLMDATDDPKALVQLATNLYNALPAWQLCGWSEQELREHETGQKTFYNPDGTVRKVGRNEPCPCGSGKKYKNCCGRGARA